MEFENFGIYLGAISRYPLQSFVPNAGTKGFPLLLGLGEQLSKEVYYNKREVKRSKNQNLAPLLPIAIGIARLKRIQNIALRSLRNKSKEKNSWLLCSKISLNYPKL
ncbi:hypothetical protein L0669_00125 [Flavobacterium bizetiae]|uniref:hypothetical protein n=1 Tax=Flavobacterium bizetiae TaxID=2704140 RepID=UPI0021E829FC|nr:hypothetical protein [Flavobacterium bizetiae]UTN04327.1 hypothetical protein L0669_00125 [Flavobacterium bizetiae]